MPSKLIATVSEDAPRESKGRLYPVEVDKKGLPTRDSLQAQLNSASDSITSRLESIQTEVSSTGDTMRAVFRDKPFLAIATALGLGIAIGYGFGGSDKEKVSTVDALANGVREAVQAGADPAIVFKAALDKIAPLDSLSSSKKAQAGGSVSSAASSLIKVGLGLALQRLPALFSDGSKPA